MNGSKAKLVRKARRALVHVRHAEIPDPLAEMILLGEIRRLQRKGTRRRIDARVADVLAKVGS